MRTYYIFNINKTMNTLYDKKTNNVFKVLKSIYETDQKKSISIKKTYLRLIKPLRKSRIDNYLIMKHSNDLYYTKYDNIHKLISEKEYSNLIIKNTFMKIKSSNNISSFLKDLVDINDNLFVVDFNNNDYFYLEDLKVKLLV